MRRSDRRAVDEASGQDGDILGLDVLGSIAAQQRFGGGGRLAAGALRLACARARSVLALTALVVCLAGCAPPGDVVLITVDALLAWFAQERDPARPLFLWVHYIDPHGPYRPPASWKQAFQHSKPKVPVPLRKIQRYVAEYGHDDAWRYVDRYDDEIAYVDSEIGRLLDGYGGRLDRALVILTADHGETMIEQEKWFTHGYHIYESIVRVPLLVRGPDVPAQRIAAPAQGTDIAPTVLRFTGGEVPDAMPAIDLRTGEGLGPERSIVVEATGREGQWRAVIRGDEKWSVDLRGRQKTPKVRRHQNLEREGLGAPRLPWNDEDSGARLLLDLVESDPHPAGVPREYPRGNRIRAAKVDPRVDEETLEKLRTLGYAE